jgi:hypothetical protein
MNDGTEFDGYTVAYDRDEIQFPVYVLVVVGTIMLASSIMHHNIFIFALGLAAAFFSFYNFPLLETGKPRLGAGQYGMFVEGLGVIPWRSIAKIDLEPVMLRGMLYHELHVTLARPLSSALVADWRHGRWHRTLMRVPWSQHDNLIRIPLDVFDHEPQDIYRSFDRLWRYFRS